MGVYRRDYRKNKEGRLTHEKKEERKSTGTRRAGSKTRSMGSGQEGTSGYLKSKKKTLKELDKAIGEGAQNDLETTQQVMDYEDEESKGITQHIRDIFSK